MKYIYSIYFFLSTKHLPLFTCCLYFKSFSYFALKISFLGLIRCYKIMEKVVYTSDFYFFSLRNDDVKTVTFT